MYDLVMITIDRDDVEAGNIHPALSTLHKLTETPELIRRYQEKVDIAFNGFDHHPEEIFEIPFVRQFVHDLDDAFPYWLYFLSKECLGLQAILLCFLPPFLEESHKKELFPPRIADLLTNRWFPALNQICDYAELSEEDIQDISQRTEQYVFHGPLITETSEPDDIFADYDSYEASTSGSTMKRFNLSQDDLKAVEIARMTARRMLKVDNLPPMKIKSLANVLYVLDRLPEATNDVNISFDTSLRFSNEERHETNLRYVQFELSENSFSITVAGYVSYGLCGGDSYTDSYCYFDLSNSTTSECDLDSVQQEVLEQLEYIEEGVNTDQQESGFNIEDYSNIKYEE